MGIWKRHSDVEGDLTAVDAYIRDTLKSGQRLLTDAVEELLMAGGKRLRPAFVLLAGSFGRYDREKLIPLAAAVEILHMATLVHDDIIDASKVRRGRPTVQSRFGSDIAVFAGDFLFTRAFSVVTQKTSHENMHRLSRGIKAICEGEIDQYESRFSRELSLRRYLKRIARKTALLFAICCHVGAEECRCKPVWIRHLTLFGKEFGMAFQITDDLLDFSGRQEEVGKPLLTDFSQGIYTLPVIYTLRQPGYGEKLSAILGQETSSSEDLALVRQLVEESGGLEASRSLAKRYLDRARSHLEALPDTPAKAILKELLEELIERRY